MRIKLLSALALVAFSFTSGRAAEAMDEQQFQKLMKEVGNVAKQFKDNAAAKNAAVVEKDSARTSEIYKQMAAFWKARQADEAVKLSEQSAVEAGATAMAAMAGDWDKVKTSWGAVGQHCKSCHEKFREKLEDGTYKIKQP